jgi:hypothetical protein
MAYWQHPGPCGQPEPAGGQPEPVGNPGRRAGAQQLRPPSQHLQLGPGRHNMPLPGQAASLSAGDSAASEAAAAGPAWARTEHTMPRT